MTPHTLVGEAQTTLTATASARADRRDCPSEAWGPQGKTHTPPLEPDAVARGAQATGAAGTGPKAEEAAAIGWHQGGKQKGVNP